MSVRKRTETAADNRQSAYTIAMARERRGAASEASSSHLKDRSRGAPSARPGPHHNHLLDALPASDYRRLQAHLELIPMALGEVLYEPGGRLRHVYFPTTSIVSLLYVMEDGASAEIAVVGNEGMLGISLF